MWKSIPCSISELRLDRTLACGQSFRWKEHSPGLWTGVIGKNVWRLKQSDTELFYQVYSQTITTKGITAADLRDDKTVVKKEISERNASRSRKKSKGPKTSNVPADMFIKQENTLSSELYSVKDEVKEEDILKDYFQLHINLEELYETWAKADQHFCKVSKDFTGIRMIRQPPMECLFSFICSSNNHISRITSMIDNLTSNYGEKILELDDQSYYAFPSVKALSAEGVEERLRTLGFGYRAKYIQASARYIQNNGGEDWLYSLRTMDYKEAKSELVKLCGVGAKVADCVGLFCLDKHGAIPVDTHVWQIALRDYMPKLKQSKSLTDKLYDEIGDFFRSLWGPYAGWAHSVLFTADLKQFKDPSKKSPVKRKSPKTENLTDLQPKQKRNSKRK